MTPNADVNAEAPTELQKPEPVEESPAVQSPPALGKWPWQVSAAIAGVALIAVLAVLALGWNYIVQHDEAQEQADWEQLLGIIDRVQNIALFVLGALLGVSVTGAAAKGAANAADQNKKEAEKQHDAAIQNMQAAENNMKVAELAVGDTRAAASELASQIARVKAASGQDILDRIGEDIQVLDLSRTDSIEALSDLGLNGAGRYVVLPQSSLDAVRAPDTREAEKLVADLQDRWA
ncbi:hypothetical protein SAMN05428985_104446 [Nocardioides sp. YR527]|uniref:hypothetical protein n=1 Tax=Nocardioides sp. YR527 TaxID=1881028 RepID=UPI00088C757E|nr:hypothetical protein [Nocardioides sp. YR527]SDK54652.1 hypothetical protein SAMN05428985_104446 [Nocardioides sp. YR527]